MKLLLVLSVLLLGFIEQQDASEGSSFEIVFDDDDRECMTKLGLEEDVVKHEFGRNFKVVEGNPQINKFLACSCNTKGIWTAYGGLNQLELKKFLKNWDIPEIYRSFHIQNTTDIDATVDHAINICSHMRGRDTGDTITKFYNCMVDHILLKKLF